VKRLATLMLLGALAAPAAADPVSNPIAVFAGLDKITGSITAFEIDVGQTKRFGTLNIHPFVCHTQPVTEEPKTTAFVQVDDNLLDGTLKRIFSGWMLAESPGLNAVEHPVYDVWLTGCRNPNAPPSETGAEPQGNVLDNQSTDAPPDPDVPAD